MFKREQDARRVEFSSFLDKPAYLVDIEEKFPSRAVIHYQVEFCRGLEGWVKFDYEGMIREAL